ncbi:hypothetical protein SAMN04489712_107259 [Thermomonospora echinospora]|uniref:Uncharacterized protein n=1 Tax=Thermomonospora echinospora TaxID=1992 RepID=A0A1H6BNG5_9ACTN|nr:hypothetical protein [Thermomonospora echinospora]SEG61947.1 hypothetical protein SAMN04489712_107259 [Thermomonospora echinospora]
MTPDSTETATPYDTRLEYLERLGDALVHRGFQVRLSAPLERPASLHVMNPEATALTENILAEQGSDGWWFWWSWAERIAAADDVATAADRVARVLAVH